MSESNSTIYDHFHYAMLDSITQALDNTMEFAYRRMCREFSSKFNTPLREVEDLPIGYVLRHVLEARLDGQYPEDLMETAAVMLKSPEDVVSEEQHMINTVKMIEAQEEERLKKLADKKEAEAEKIKGRKAPAEVKKDFTAVFPDES